MIKPDPRAAPSLPFDAAAVCQQGTQVVLRKVSWQCIAEKFFNSFSLTGITVPHWY
jgi:hypothetical protein